MSFLQIGKTETGAIEKETIREKLGKQKSERVFLFAFAVFSIVGILINIPYCFDKMITYDSSYQYGLTRHSWAEIWRLLPEDYSPPLYTVLLKLVCMVFGYSLKVMRFSNSVVIVGLMFLSFFPVRRAFGAKTGTVTAVFFLCSSVNAFLFSEIRPTYLAYFLVTGAAVYAYLSFFDGKTVYYICHALFSVLAMYTHNVGMLAALGIYMTVVLFSVIKKNKKKFLTFFLSGCICAVLYSPWLIVVLKQVENVKRNFWTGQTSTLTSLYNDCVKSILYIDYLIRPTTIPVLIEHIMVLLSVLVIAYGLIRKFFGAKKETLLSGKDKSTCKKGVFLALLVLMPLLVFEVLSRTVYHFATNRYYYLFTGTIIILFAAVINKIGHRVFLLLFPALIVINSIAIHYDTFEYYNLSEAQAFIDTVEKETMDGDICFLHSHEWTIGVASYHFPNGKQFLFNGTWSVLNDFSVFDSNIIYLDDPESIAGYTDHFYVFQPYFSNVEADLPAYFEENDRFVCHEVRQFVYSRTYPPALRLVRVDVVRNGSSDEAENS